MPTRESQALTELAQDFDVPAEGFRTIDDFGPLRDDGLAVVIASNPRDAIDELGSPKFTKVLCSILNDPALPGEIPLSTELRKRAAMGYLLETVLTPWAREELLRELQSQDLDRADDRFALEDESYERQRALDNQITV